ncbi:hypothetical protein V6N11_035757 [Hibiscus sabdariffa]|uniref:Uncharacterized protein n=1 Tax=Hibiscus sabdariffa TaxID=183260 RepID=A0ABR2R8G1_9ROSI
MPNDGTNLLEVPGVEAALGSNEAAPKEAPGSRPDLVAAPGSYEAAPKEAPGSRPDLVAVDPGLSTQAVPSRAASAMVLQQSAGTIVVEGASRLAASTLTDSPLAPQHGQLDGKYPLAVRPPSAMMVNTTSPTRISKRALQGKYEVLVVGKAE